MVKTVTASSKPQKDVYFLYAGENCELYCSKSNLPGHCAPSLKVITSVEGYSPQNALTHFLQDTDLNSLIEAKQKTLLSLFVKNKQDFLKETPEQTTKRLRNSLSIEDTVSILTVQISALQKALHKQMDLYLA